MSNWTPSTPEAAREYLRGGQPTPSVTDASLAGAVQALEKSVESFCGRTKDGVREIVLRDDIADLRRAHGTEKIPAHFLAPDYQQSLEKEAADRYAAEMRSESESIGPTITDLDTKLVAAMERARRLPSEAEHVNPDTNHAGWVQARLLDSTEGREAREWLDTHKDDPKAILARYESADDRADNALVRKTERRFGFAPDEPNVTESDAGAKTRLLVMSPLQKAVRARQDARVPKSLAEDYQRLQRARSTYAFAKAESTRDTLGMTRALLTRAK
jgi:hypothetical protein